MNNRFITFINIDIRRGNMYLIAILIFFIYQACNQDTQESESSPIIERDTVFSQIDTSKFLDIPLANRKMHYGIIEKNQMLANILSPFQVDGNTIAAMAVKYKSVFDVRKIRSGNEYAIIFEGDSLKKAKYFAYKHSPYQFIVFAFGDSNYVYSHNLATDTIQKTISAKITGSLIKTLLDQGIPGELGFKLSEILAWQIDFFKIQKDDWVKVIYEEIHVEGKFAEIGLIKAVEFNWMGTSYYGYFYEQDANNKYFDNNGKSLRKAFLKAPLDYSRISSRYTLKRFHPVQKIWKAHLGTDYAAPPGTPIRSVGDGLVIESGYGRGNGNYVKVRHNETYTTQYLHMRKIDPSARKGKSVRQGQIIGYVGSTGLATGPHLCFRFWKNGKQIDPFTVKTPPTIPIKPEHAAQFEKTKLIYQNQLNALTLK